MPLDERFPAIAEKIQGLAMGHSQIMSEEKIFIKLEILGMLNLFLGVLKKGFGMSGELRYTSLVHRRGGE